MPAKEPVIAIIDIGKTNKKWFLFDEHYQMVHEASMQLPETIDEDGDACENLESLRLWVSHSMQEIFRQKNFDVKAMNCSAYGASFVYIDKEGKPVAPLYNYLKPFPQKLQQQFYDMYGGEETFSFQTASPVLGNLNSGLQLYRVKYEKPELFKQIKYALHLPQYISYLISGKVCSDLTSIGCHTALWNFQKNQYHEWVYQEGIVEKLALIVPANEVISATFEGNTYAAGIGLHDSSAALIPYQVRFQKPFVLISTGTWCISLNPFNDTPLTLEELQKDCLCYIAYQGKPVKASRVFAGNEHEEEVKRIAAYFHQTSLRYKAMEFNPDVIAKLQKNENTIAAKADTINMLKRSRFAQRGLSQFEDDEEAYHQLILDIIEQQKASTQLVLNDTSATRIFVDGGFSKNAIYMNLLAVAFPQMEVFAASTAQATAVGTALAIHRSWNTKPLPNDIIELRHYASTYITS